MPRDRQIHRDASDAASAETRGGHALIRGFGRRADLPVRLSIGAAIGRDQLDPLVGDAKTRMAFLRRKTYELASEPVDPMRVGHEWD